MGDAVLDAALRTALRAGLLKGCSWRCAMGTRGRGARSSDTQREAGARACGGGRAIIDTEADGLFHEGAQIRAKEVKRVCENKCGWLCKRGLTNTSLQRRW